MKLITLDFETYYDQQYSLSKLTTEEYIRDPRFEPLIVGVKVDDQLPLFQSGRTNIQVLLDALDIENNAVLCHHAHFDGLILSHHFGHKPKVWFDTLSKARAIHGIEVSGSLKKLMEFYAVGEKGDEVVKALGKRLADFTPADLLAYARYCINDVEGTYQIFQRMLQGFPRKELRIIDMVIRMFTEPEVLLDERMLRAYKEEIAAEKMTLLFEAGITLDEVMSDGKFAAALERCGVAPPMKVSLRTGKQAFAFAKTDEAFLELQEHDDLQVQALVAARLGNKTTINETRAQRMADMAMRGPAPIYLKYSGAGQTHRLSGGDNLNWQNMQRGGTLRRAIYAPLGKVFVVADSRNIEARVLDWLAMQDDAVDVYRAFDAGEGPDVYCVMASKIYNRPITPDDKEERQLGKVAKLQLGYQSGGPRFKESARILGRVTIDLATATNVVNIYRATHPMVKILWTRGQNAIPAILAGPDGDKYLDPRNLIEIRKGALRLPNGLLIRYPDLRCEGGEWSFQSRKNKRAKLYGGKVVENIVQALARIIVLEQTLEISARTPVKLSVHDEGVFLVDEEAADDVRGVALEVMGRPLSWCPDLPLAAQVSIARRYGDAK